MQFKVIDIPDYDGPHLLYLLDMHNGLELVVTQLLMESYVKEFIEYVDTRDSNRHVYCIVLKHQYNTTNIRESIIGALQNCIAMAPAAYKQRGIF